MVDTMVSQEQDKVESLFSVEINPNLEPWEVEEAEKMLNWITGDGEFLGVAGFILVTGLPRQGKGTFINPFAWKLNRYFGKRILRDDHPTTLFGKYTLFNEDVLIEDVSRMAQVAREDIPKEARGAKQKQTLKRAVETWITEEGEVFLQDAVVMLDEFWRYMNNRRPMNPMNIALSGLIKMMYHTDTLYMGVAQRKHELDRFTCLPYVTHEARCQWCTDRESSVRVDLQRVMWSGGRSALVPVGKGIILYVDGGRPRDELGGKRYFDLFKSKSAPMMVFKHKFSI